MVKPRSTLASAGSASGAPGATTRTVERMSRRSTGRRCALILADTWPEKVGKGLMFISLNVEPATRETAAAALDALRAELEARGVPVKEGSWGYRVLVVDDPDGNELFFNYPNETASGKITRDDLTE